jgi:hypothetical protein
MLQITDSRFHLVDDHRLASSFVHKSYWIAHVEIEDMYKLSTFLLSGIRVCGYHLLTQPPWIRIILLSVYAWPLLSKP